MGGREAIRGFAVQALICLLDSLQLENSSWKVVVIEPDSSNDKVDIRWEYSDGKIRVQQIKSSKNQIGRGDVVSWCKELEASGPADSYQLILAGPIAAAVLDDAPFGQVEVPVPKSMDTLALIEQAITKVDRYLSAKGIAPLSLPIRESLIYIVTARLLDGAVRGHRLSRDEFDGWLLRWIAAAYPEAVEQRMSANCAVLWSSVEFASPATISQRAFELNLPLTVINGGASTAVVEFFLLRVCSSNREMRYRPALVLPDVGGQFRERRSQGRPFGEFAVPPQSSIQMCVLFTPIDGVAYKTDEWPREKHHIELYVKYGAQRAMASVKRAPVQIGIEETSVLGTNNSRQVALSAMDAYLDLL
ncbi:hypothetical protein AB4Y44_01250 [Paraburkholderia sp. BR10937]|uniref:hypothetical protein n=1 Tax=Paraburkholderia sp. BR10937 TaxID=3236994 RepID=UPI0034D2F4F6